MTRTRKNHCHEITSEWLDGGADCIVDVLDVRHIGESVVGRQARRQYQVMTAVCASKKEIKNMCLNGA